MTNETPTSGTDANGSPVPVAPPLTAGQRLALLESRIGSLESSFLSHAVEVQTRLAPLEESIGDEFKAWVKQVHTHLFGAGK